MIRHKVYAQDRETGQILYCENFDAGDIASALIEYKRQFNHFQEAVGARSIIVYMCSTGVG
jgi:hypothetical protein